MGSEPITVEEVKKTLASLPSVAASSRALAGQKTTDQLIEAVLVRANGEVSRDALSTQTEALAEITATVTRRLKDQIPFLLPEPPFGEDLNAPLYAELKSLAATSHAQLVEAHTEATRKLESHCEPLAGKIVKTFMIDLNAAIDEVRRQRQPAFLNTFLDPPVGLTQGGPIRS